jgi:hypothetical protein
MIYIAIEEAIQRRPEFADTKGGVKDVEKEKGS